MEFMNSAGAPKTPENERGRARTRIGSNPRSRDRSCDRFIPHRAMQNSEISSWLLRKETTMALSAQQSGSALDVTDKSNREQRYQQEVAARLLDNHHSRSPYSSPYRSPVAGGGNIAAGEANSSSPYFSPSSPSGRVHSNSRTRTTAWGRKTQFGNTPRVLNFAPDTGENGGGAERRGAEAPGNAVDGLHSSPRKQSRIGELGMEAHACINALHSKMSMNDSLKRKTKRAIPTAPERVLDAPGLLNDYYLNLVDWNCKNILAVALDKTVYLWNAATREIQELLTLEHENYVSSLSYVHEGGNLLAVGTSDRKVEIWDTVKLKRTRVMGGHMSRVGSLAWRGQMLTSGSKDTVIINHDHRASAHIVSRYRSHKQEVCGLAWNADGLTLASGGNDNLLALWDIRRQNTGEKTYFQPTHSCTDHLAAVKALAWSPHQRNVLATGGGTADRTIKIWNAANGKCLNSVNTGSQVCSLIWNKNEKELLSSHGFSENQLCLWKYPSMERLAELKGHTGRVLYMCQGPTGQICSAGADETLRFWNVFGSQGSSLVSKKHAAMSGSRKKFTTRVTIR